MCTGKDYTAESALQSNKTADSALPTQSVVLLALDTLHRQRGGGGGGGGEGKTHSP